MAGDLGRLMFSMSSRLQYSLPQVHTSIFSSLLQSLEAFFGTQDGKPRIPFRATLKNCTCCVIKPHAFIDGNVGSIIEHIVTSDKFHITAMAIFSLNVVNAREFYEVYRDVLPTYEVNISL